MLKIFLSRIVVCALGWILLGVGLAGQDVTAQETVNTETKRGKVDAKLDLKHVVFRATFDAASSAEIGAGDKRIYTAESLERKKVEVGLKSRAVRLEKTQDPRRKQALHFVAKTKELVFFKGGANVPYAKSDFEGTVSLWMRLSPKEDLPKGYVDPLQITDKKWNDASIFIDFDQAKERPFRLGFFSDYKFWNPKDTKFDDIAQKDRPMVPVTKWPFDNKEWTHVAFTWKHVNTDKDATVSLYLNGKLQGSLNTKQRFTWNPDKCVIMLGINYIGWLDDLLIMDQALTGEQIQTLMAL